MRFFPLVLLAFVLSGCSAFGSKDGTEPMELVDFEPSVNIDRLWQRDTGAGQGQGFTTLTPAFLEDLAYTVDYKGHLTALNRFTGKVVWKRELGRDHSRWRRTRGRSAAAWNRSGGAFGFIP